MRLWFANEDYQAMNGLYSVQQLQISSDFKLGLTLAGWSSDILYGWSVDLETEFTAATA